MRDDDGRTSLIEAELVPAGRNRVQVNRQRLERARDLLGVVRVTVFSPDDLTLVKGGPADRRRFLDDTLVALAVKYDAARLELDRIVRQRNTLLRQVGGRLDADATTTLDVWDARFCEAGERLGRARDSLVERIRPFVGEAYAHLAGRPTDVGLIYDPPWRHTGLAAALRRGPRRRSASRRVDRRAAPRRARRCRSTGSRRARTPRRASSARSPSPSASAPTGWWPSAPARSRCSCSTTCCPSSIPVGRGRCSRHLPQGQVVITTASAVPPSAKPDRVLRIVDGTVSVDEEIIAGEVAS